MITGNACSEQPFVGTKQNCCGKPYWYENSPLTQNVLNPLPADVDVAIVGSGYTGLNAALVTAKAGKSSLVLDAKNIGFGCSTRNGGQVSTSIKPSYERLRGRFGSEKAKNIRQEGVNALNWLENFINEEEIECNFYRCGRLHAAHTPKHYDKLCRSIDLANKFEGAEAYAVPQENQRNEVGSTAYFGGVVFPKHASLDPAKLHSSVVKKAIESGVQFSENCNVATIEKCAAGFRLHTSRGIVRARDVVVATGGYSGPLSKWLQRRIIPIGSYVVATEPLPEELVDELLPTNRIVNDTCKVVYYYRASPDRSRLLFGGRVSAAETSETISGERLYSKMCRIFPQISSYGISHSWSGKVAYTFDEVPHVGVHDGMYFAMGFCGQGISLSSYLGMRIGERIVDQRKGNTAFDGIPFPTRPLYQGNPWFLPAAVTWYRCVDKFQSMQAKRARGNPY